MGWTRERGSETGIIQKIIQVATKIKNKNLKSILLSSRHKNKNKTVVFATIVHQRVFCSKKEPRCPYPCKTMRMASTSNDKNKTIKNLMFTNLRWHSTAKKVEGKHTNRITGRVTTKSICMSIQKPVKAPIITHNKYAAIESDELVAYGNYRQPWKQIGRASCRERV